MIPLLSRVEVLRISSPKYIVGVGTWGMEFYPYLRTDLGPFTNGGHSIQDQLIYGGHSEWELNLN